MGRRVVPMLLLLFLAAIPAGAAEQRTVVPLDDSPSLGPQNAPVTIVEFIDFQ